MRRLALLLPLLFASVVVAAPAPLPKPVRKPVAEKLVKDQARVTKETRDLVDVLPAQIQLLQLNFVPPQPAPPPPQQAP